MLVTASGGSVPLSLLPWPSTHLSCKTQGRVSWVSLTPNMWCLSKQHPVIQTPMGCVTTQFNSERKLGEVTCILHVESQNCPKFRNQPCVPIRHYFAKCLKLGSSINPPPGSITQLISWPNSEDSHITTLPVLTAQRLSESPHLWILLVVSLNRNFDWLMGQWGLFPVSVLSPLPRATGRTNL